MDIAKSSSEVSDSTPFGVVHVVFATSTPPAAPESPAAAPAAPTTACPCDAPSLNSLTRSGTQKSFTVCSSASWAAMTNSAMTRAYSGARVLHNMHVAPTVPLPS